MNSRKRKNVRREKKDNRKIYITGMSILAALVCVAFFAPQMLFSLQDKMRSGGYLFFHLEQQDITLLGNSYETSLYYRLERFAQAVESEADIYVTSQEMTTGQEMQVIYEFLMTDKGLYQESLLMWVDSGLFSREIVSESFEVTDWRQYVIYSDNFANGVNFILWYVELEYRDGQSCKILFDAETGSVYAVTAQNQFMNVLYGDEAQGLTTSKMLDYFVWNFGDTKDSVLNNLWMVSAYLCGGFNELIDGNESMVIIKNYDYDLKQMYDTESTYVDASPENVLQDRLKDMDMSAWSVSEEEGKIDFHLPYEGGSLSYRIDLFKNTIGFPAIYERIPEFNE